MKDLIKSLAGVSAPAGAEQEVIRAIRARVEGVADEVYTDTLGNLYAIKKPAAGASSSVKTVLVAAHADEPGVTVVDIDDEGFLRIAPLGHLAAADLVGRRVRFVRSKILGVIYAEGDAKRNAVDFSQLFVDIAVSDQEEARKLVQIGDAAAFAYEMQEVTPRVLLGHALDNRVACAVAINLLASANVPFQLVVVFSVQQQVGSRGIQVAGYRINPDLAMVLDATPTGDTPKAKRLNLTMGSGVAIKALDAGMAVAPALVQHLIEVAEKAQIPYQIDVSPEAHTDAANLQIARSGIPTCGLSVPTRYLDTPSQMMHMDDVDAMGKLLQAWMASERLFDV